MDFERFWGYSQGNDIYLGQLRQALAAECMAPWALSDFEMCRQIYDTPRFHGLMEPALSAMPEHSRVDDYGSVYLGVGLPSVVRIPIPQHKGFFLELNPRGRPPKTGTTSTIFFHNITGKKHLRLDYGPIVKGGKDVYHWNTRRATERFGIADHTLASKGEKALYKGAKVYRYLGKTFVVVGAANDYISIVVAKNPVRQTAKVGGGWAGAWLGCQAVGAMGIQAGGWWGPPGMAVGGIVGCVIGGIGGYEAGSWAFGEAYDRLEELK